MYRNLVQRHKEGSKILDKKDSESFINLTT